MATVSERIGLASSHDGKSLCSCSEGTSACSSLLSFRYVFNASLEVLALDGQLVERLRLFFFLPT